MRDFVMNLLSRMEIDFAEADAGRIAGHYADTAVLQDMTIDQPLHGRAAIAEALTELFTALTEVTYTTTVVCDDGATAVVEWVTKGRHTGSFADETPTGNLVNYCGVNLLSFDADGLISEERCYWDSAALARQLESA